MIYSLYFEPSIIDCFQATLSSGILPIIFFQGGVMEQKNQKKQKKSLSAITIIALSLVGLILLAAGISFLTNQTLPEPSSTPDELSQQDLAYAEEALHLMSELGDQTWPGLSGNIPLILWNEDYAFLINSQEKLSGWNKFQSATINDLPVYVQKNDANYQAFTEILSNEQYAGSMATKTTTNVGFINLFKQDLPPIVAKIFPYRLMLISTDQYITALVHENFHAFQAENYPDRFQDAEKAYRSAEAYEKLFPEMGETWEVEIQHLLDAIDQKDPETQKEIIREFLITREQRRDMVDLSDALALYEKRFEWLEGSAKYVELEIWRNGASSASYQPISKIHEDNDFDAYQGFEKRWKNELNNAKTAAKNGSETMFYYTGMLQAKLLDQLMPEWKTRISEPGTWYENLLKEAVNY